MVNYSASESSMSGGSLVGGSKVGGSEIGGSSIGGALNVLSQYEANEAGDEYSSKNPSNEYLEMLKAQKGGSLDALKNAGKMLNSDVANHILKLTMPQHHALVEVAKAALRHSKGGSLIPFHNVNQQQMTDNFAHFFGAGLSGGALADIASSKSPSHLASMVMNDHHMKKEEGASLVGGSFLDDVGKTASSLAPLLPFIL